MEFNKVIEIDNHNISRSIVRFNNTLIDRTKKSKTLFHRRSPLKITNKNNGQWSIAFAYGSPGIKGLTKKTIGIDYDTADVLGIALNDTAINVEVKRAKSFDLWSWYLNHPDHFIAFNTKVTLVALVLGIVSLLITFL